jgi:hypothetical protein
MSRKTTDLHGGTRYNRGCTCDVCLRAHRERLAQLRREHAAARVLIDGRLVATGAPQHGSRSTYVNWMCRCVPCTAAHTASLAARRRRT